MSERTGDRPGVDADGTGDIDADTADNTDGGGTDDYRLVFENRVRVAETDRAGIVFYGEYVTFQDEAVSAYRREMGFDSAHAEAAGWSTRVVSTTVDYHDSARFEEVLENEVRVGTIGETSVTYDWRVSRERDGRLLADGSVTQVFVDDETGEPIRVPDAFREAVTDFQAS